MTDRARSRTGPYSSAGYFFAVLFLAALVGFWPRYLSKLPLGDAHTHFHAFLMTVWCVMLIAQAFLIRTGRRPLHRRLGRASYVVGPLVVVSMITLAHHRLTEAGPEVGTGRIILLYIQLYETALFAVTFGLALANRREPAIHARYMICNAVNLLNAILSRVLNQVVFPNVDFAHWYVPLVLADLILVWLIVVDWRKRGSSPVYPAMLVALVVFQLGIFVVPGLEAWQRFVHLFRALPLS